MCFLSKDVEVHNVNLGDWCPKTMLSDVEPLIVDFGDRVGEMGIVERVELMALAAQALQELGQLKNPSFNYSFFYPQFLYAVRPDGEVLEFVHEIVEDRNPPSSDSGIQEHQIPRPRPDFGALGIQERQSSPRPDSGDFQERTDSGDFQERTSVVLAPIIRQKLVGPYHAKKGWNVYANAHPGGVYGLGAAVYTVTPSGDMNWYRHDNYRGGTDKWTAPKRVGWGWGTYRKIIAGGDGILYGLAGDGTLYWYKHLDVANASDNPQWSGRFPVHTGWGDLVHIFSGGEGVMYVVRQDGNLLWYRHKGYQTGTDDWEGPKEVGTGWAHFKSLFSTGEGHIYAIQPNGDLYAYHHTGYKDGQPFWNPNLILGHGWDSYAFVFPAMWGTPAPSIGPR